MKPLGRRTEGQGGLSLVMRVEMLMSLNRLFDYLLIRLNNGLEPAGALPAS